MSMTESKAPTKGKTTRPVKTTKKNALVEKIEAALAKAVRKTATLGQLVLTDLNVRKKKSSQASIEGLAAAIRSAGLLMNLVVFEMEDGRYGVAAGERRTLALRWLMEQENDADKTTPDGIVTDDYPVEVLVVSRAMARVVSMMENSQREQMHPADRSRRSATCRQTGKLRHRSAFCWGSARAMFSAVCVWLRWHRCCSMRWPTTRSPSTSCRRCRPPTIINVSVTSGKTRTVGRLRRSTCARRC
ncbi:TPA: ParB/Srx family N-terminal domain-containing protein [Serratia marcescens]